MLAVSSFSIQTDAYVIRDILYSLGSVVDIFKLQGRPNLTQKKLNKEQKIPQDSKRLASFTNQKNCAYFKTASLNQFECLVKNIDNDVCEFGIK